MKKLIYAILLTLGLGMFSASQAADTTKANDTQTVQSGSSSTAPTQSGSKHKKKHHHKKKDKKDKADEQPKA